MSIRVPPAVLSPGWAWAPTVIFSCPPASAIETLSSVFWIAPQIVGSRKSLLKLSVMVTSFGVVGARCGVAFFFVVFAGVTLAGVARRVVGGLVVAGAVAGVVCVGGAGFARWWCRGGRAAVGFVRAAVVCGGSSVTTIGFWPAASVDGWSAL